jgi:hypothetical protein
MKDLSNIFSSESENIDIAGIESLAKLCNYHPQKKDIFLDGLELAEDLNSEKGVTLYTQGTVITIDRITRLLSLKESNPNLIMMFKIKRSAKLIANFKKEIIHKFTKAVDHRKNYKIYFNLMKNVAGNLNPFLDELLSDEDILLTVYKMKFISEMTASKNASLFFTHTINVATFAYAIANLPDIRNLIKFEKSDFTDLLHAAMFHNIGALMEIDKIVGVKDIDKLKRYNEANKKSGYHLNTINLNFDVMDAIRYIGEYYYERYDFIPREDNVACWIANIVVASDLYARFESGLFGVSKKPSQIIDSLNLMARDEKLNLNVVKAFTLGLNLKDIFDFYQEMELLQKMCDYKKGGYAWPYPMTGFKSPTIFICQGSFEGCEYFDKSVKAVTLVRPMGKLEEGKYARCQLTSPKLIQFYKDHYEEIKKDLKDMGPQTAK